MNRADNSAFLAQANARRHQAALAAAHHAIDQLRREGKPVTYAAVAHAAGVSRTWLYSQEQIRDLISDLRQRSRGGPACNRHAHGVVARHPTATRTTTKPAPTRNGATTPTGVTLSGG